jgi:energy-converting hydrogenase Eha subunit F
MEFVKLRGEGKDRSYYAQQLYVGVLSALSAYMMGASPMTRIATNVGVDFGTEIAMSVAGIEDKVLFSGNA